MAIIDAMRNRVLWHSQSSSSADEVPQAGGTTAKASTGTGAGIGSGILDATMLRADRVAAGAVFERTRGRASPWRFFAVDGATEAGGRVIDPWHRPHVFTQS